MHKTPDDLVTLRLPPDLLAFARACAGSDDIAECVAIALELLRSRVYELAGSDEANRPQQ